MICASVGGGILPLRPSGVFVGSLVFLVLAIACRADRPASQEQKAVGVGV